ncbi:hypothetical protein HOH15_07375 [Candidatus Woesearchaeota archaeon]|nr:hypothetical protein [Candidatus Woesearchaeota archaeon]
MNSRNEDFDIRILEAHLITQAEFDACRLPEDNLEELIIGNIQGVGGHIYTVSLQRNNEGNSPIIEVKTQSKESFPKHFRREEGEKLAAQALLDFSLGLRRITGGYIKVSPHGVIYGGGEIPFTINGELQSHNLKEGPMKTQINLSDKIFRNQDEILDVYHKFVQEFYPGKSFLDGVAPNGCIDYCGFKKIWKREFKKTNPWHHPAILFAGYLGALNVDIPVAMKINKGSIMTLTGYLREKASHSEPIVQRATYKRLKETDVINSGLPERRYVMLREN